MTAPLIRTETAVEYFKELVETALDHQRIQAGELTSHYVVNLLAGYVRRAAAQPDPIEGEPLALRLARAHDSAGEAQRAHLRALGDAALFVAGFFADSLNRRVVDLDYYIAIGGHAYQSLSQRDATAFAEVFAELGEKFIGFVDVLSEVSEQSAVTTNGDLLRLYERWLRTGSQRNGQLLVERGIVPNASIGSRFVQ